MKSIKCSGASTANSDGCLYLGAADERPNLSSMNKNPEASILKNCFSYAICMEIKYLKI